MNSPPARSYPKRGQRTATSYSGRRQRRSAGVPSRHPVLEQSSGAAQKWTRVLRNPTSPLGEPYFGSGPAASFQIPMWVRISDLTEEEKLKYEEAERKKEEKRIAWKKAVDERRFSEADTTGEDDNEGGVTKDEGVNESIHRRNLSNNDEIAGTNSPVDESDLQSNYGPECIDKFYKCEHRADSSHLGLLSSTELTERTATDPRKPADEGRDASLTKVEKHAEPCESAFEDTPMEVERNDYENNTEQQHQQHEFNFGHTLPSSLVKEEKTQMINGEAESPSQQPSEHVDVAINGIDPIHPFHKKQRCEVIRDQGKGLGS